MERIRDYVHVAGANLRLSPLRSILSILGIVVGTASVISVLALGAGARRELIDSVTQLGSDVYRITPMYNAKRRRQGVLTIEDVERVRSVPAVLYAFADISVITGVRSNLGDGRTKIIGADDGYLKMNRLVLKSGRDLNPIDNEERRLVCAINANTAKAIFPNIEEALGAELFMLGERWTVAGVYVPESGGSKGRTIEILAPMATLLRLAKEPEIEQLVLYVPLDSGDTVRDQIAEAFYRNDAARKDLFDLESDRERIKKRIENRRLLFVLWTAIASISLVVGGIGMMNVMLTSVAERTREIGLRRAIGARRKDILIQFLVESCILSVLGGILGLFAGAALARSLPALLKDFGLKSAVMEPSFAFLAVGAGMLLGIIFGLYPAVKAAAFSPAEALRYD